MAVQPLNLVQGPATLYYGLFGIAAEPPTTNAALLTDPNSAGGSGWTDAGATNGGVTFELEQTYTKLEVDQLVDPVGARLTARVMALTATLNELTLSNMYAAMNSLAIQVTGSGYSQLTPVTTTSATQPTYYTLCIDGWAPTLLTGTAARRRIILRKALTDTKLSNKYEKPNRAEWAATWTGYYISPSVAPFIFIDQTS